MAFPCRKFLKPKILTCLLAGLSVSILHLWFLGDPRFQPKQRSDGSLQVTHVAPAATSPSSPGPPCVANASANATADFEKLPARIQDFLRYRHCRHFPLLWDAPAKCRGSRGPFLLLAVKSAPANFERRELIRRTWGHHLRAHALKRETTTVRSLSPATRESPHAATKTQCSQKQINKFKN